MAKQRVAVTDRRSIHYRARDPEHVWGEVLEQDLEAATGLAQSMVGMVFPSGPGGWFINRLAELLYATVYEHWGRFIRESDCFADAISGMCQ